MESVDDCRISPDGRWLAYAARESNPRSASVAPLKVYVANLQNGQSKYQVSEGSGLAAQWSQDGKELYYLEQSTLTLFRVGVRFSGGVPRFHVLDKSSPNVLAELVYAVSPDDKRILIERIPEPTVVFVTNFTEGLEKK
jgi:tricorn protease-like protein